MTSPPKFNRTTALRMRKRGLAAAPLCVLIVSVATAWADQLALPTTVYRNPAFDPRLRGLLHTYVDAGDRKESSSTAAAAAAGATFPSASDQSRALYYLPQTQAQAPPEVARYRNEGNFYHAQPLEGPEPAAAPVVDAPSPPTRRRMRFIVGPPVLFSHRVVHREPWYGQWFPGDENRRRRSAADQATAQTKPTPTPMTMTTSFNPRDGPQDDRGGAGKSIARKQQPDELVTRDARPGRDDPDAAVDAVDADGPTREIRYFHDIYLRRAGPQDRTLFGHVEQGPDRSERRFESQRRSNRYRGEILWADKTGGYGEHHWDLAQGKL